MQCSGRTGGGSEAKLPELEEIQSLSGQSSSCSCLVPVLSLFLFCPCSCFVRVHVIVYCLNILPCYVQEEQKGEARLNYLNSKRYRLYPVSFLFMFLICSCSCSRIQFRNINMLCSGGTGGGSEAELYLNSKRYRLYPVSLLFMFLICS